MSGPGTADLVEALRREAGARGFALVGVTSPEPSRHMGFYRRWLAEGGHGSMVYLERADAVTRRADLSATMRSVRSVVVVAHEHYLPDPPELVADPSRGIIARYARGRDYHVVVKRRLLDLLRWLDATVEGGVRGRAYVDTGPILERELAQRAGLGWFGRNTMLIHPRRGSYFFLGVLLLDLELPADAPFEDDRCGSCRSCLDACPTGALLGRDADGAPRIDARRCVSYLTIELRGPIPVELRPGIGNRVFGCDICQEVCPFNERFAAETAEPGYAARGPGERPVGVEPEGGARGRAGPGAREGRRAPGAAEAGHPGTRAPRLSELMAMTREQWADFSRGSAIRRAGYAGFRRNVAVAMGNWLAGLDEPPGEALAVLASVLGDEEPLVREHAAWALDVAGGGV